jgi:oligosaccharide repeat unit polymerase
MKEVLVPAQIALLAVLLATYFVVPKGIDDWVIWSCLIVFYTYAWTAIQTPVFIRSGIPTFLSINVLFLIFYYILYYLPYQLHVLGQSNLYDPGPFRSSFPDQTNHAILSATIGIVAFTLGLGRAPRPLATERQSNATASPSYRQVEVWTLLALVGFIGLYVGAGWRTAGEGRYTGTASGGAAAEGAALLIIMLAIIAVSLFILELAKGSKPRLAHWLGAAVSAAWALRLLAAGDRNSFLLLALVGLAGFFSYCRPLGRVAIAVLLAGALVSYNAIEVVRMTGDLSFDAIARYLSQQSVGGDSQSSFNFTTVSVRAALYVVPSQFDYAYGFFKLVGFAGIIPLIRGMILADSGVFTSSADVVTYALLGPNPTWGVGSNVVSDIYVDFGPVGIPIVMFLVGRFARSVQAAAIRNPLSPLSISVYLATVALIAETPRYSVDFPVRILVWMALFFWLYRIVTSQRNSAERPFPVALASRLEEPQASKPEAR